MFKLLLDMGFKESKSVSIRLADGFRLCPLVRGRGNVPDDVSLQVLVQCRPELITRTFEALEGAKNPHHPFLQLDQ